MKRVRKDPKSQKYLSICDNCNEDLLEYMLFEPFWKMVVEMKKISGAKEKEFREINDRLEKLETEVKTKEKLVSYLLT